MQSFDVGEINMNYNRGSYLIVLPSCDLVSYMTNENYGGDFVKFKKTQGFDVDVVGGLNLKKYYKEKAIIKEVDANGSIEDIKDRIKGVIKNV